MEDKAPLPARPPFCVSATAEAEETARAPPFRYAQSLLKRLQNISTSEPQRLTAQLRIELKHNLKNVRIGEYLYARPLNSLVPPYLIFLFNMLLYLNISVLVKI